MAKTGTEERAQEFISAYKTRNAYGRMVLLENDLKLVKLKELRGLAIFFYGDKANCDSWPVLYRLVAYAIMEESGVIDEHQYEVLRKHRKAILANLASDGASSVRFADVQRRARKKVRKMHLILERGDDMAMETVKESDTDEEAKPEKKARAAASKKKPARAVKEEEEKVKKVKMLSLGGKKYEMDAKFKWGAGAESSKKMKKNGKGAYLAGLFKRPATFADAIEEAKAAFIAGDTKGWSIDKYVGGQVKGALRRLIRNKLIAG